MKPLAPIALFALGLTAACTAAEPVPSTAPAPQNPPTAAQAPTEPNAAADWLKRIEQRAADINTLRGKITYVTIQGLLGDEQRRFGTLVYDDPDPQAGKPARFAVHFDRMAAGGQLRDGIDRAFIFDGRWLAERIGDEKKFIRRRLGAEGEQVDLTKGPIVLPLNLKKDEVLAKFAAALVQPSGDDPEDSVHLRLTPRPGVDVEQEQIDLWFDRASLLPLRAHTIESDESETLVLLRELETNPDLRGETFNTQPPTEPGWQVDVQTQ